ncbi:MAG: undecaprenyldiphospho-muramoylpentapeptide beta-N-acetylglucosaminyltransferase [Treponema sp.]|jgi:UDP-N-acetylglucosamine--N-acetylmuramyl-(pentapeptide) pyrophosphoryl-undecaprenol N-acetylglucosamine transferase|nr:undecaprenyldiphospho-muramoylpentapeptide beta-N-acetylglucosaminyltransferase [Treponema sp.]
MVSIAFTGGGTGGHIYPGLAVAAELKKRLDGSFRLFWIGSSAGMDRKIVETAGIEFFGVPSGKLRRYFSVKTAVDFFKVIAGFFAAKRILKKQKARLLFSKGGFVSVPPCAAAVSLNIPVFTHESDFSPGLATKINARFVLRTKGKIFTAYEDTAGFFQPAVRDRVIVSGNPVRSIFYNADPSKGRAFLGVKDGARILLVLGGSQGARQINELLRACLNEITKTYTVVHQTGPNQKWDLDATETYKPFPFIGEELPHIMSSAELVLARSGAGIWECAVLGKPMLLIPLEGSGTRGDQAENARYFQSEGAAVVLTGSGASPDLLLSAIKSLEQDAGRRMAMAAASTKMGKKDGAGFIAQTLAEYIGGGKE